MQEIIKSIDPLGRTTAQTLDQWKHYPSLTAGRNRSQRYQQRRAYTELENSSGLHTYEYDNAEG